MLSRIPFPAEGISLKSRFQLCLSLVSCRSLPVGSRSRISGESAIELIAYVRKHRIEVCIKCIKRTDNRQGDERGHKGVLKRGYTGLIAFQRFQPAVTSHHPCKPSVIWIIPPGNDECSLAEDFSLAVGHRPYVDGAYGEGEIA